MLTKLYNQPWWMRFVLLIPVLTTLDWLVGGAFYSLGWGDMPSLSENVRGGCIMAIVLTLWTSGKPIKIDGDGAELK